MKAIARNPTPDYILTEELTLIVALHETGVQILESKFKFLNFKKGETAKGRFNELFKFGMDIAFN